jgi:septal ring factor EnvC (AmiA/AmiB activator)
MKRYLISGVIILTMVAVSWVAFGQPQGDFRERMAKMREAQAKAVEIIQQQAAKLATSMEPPAFDRDRFQEMSDEEREKFREQMMKQREERQQALAAIEQQVMVLKGRRSLQQEHDASIAELKEIQALATKEKAAETAKRLEKLIAKRNKEFEDTIQKLGIPDMPGRPGQGGGPGGFGGGQGQGPGQGR